jgi:hypothetical protein
MISVNQLQNRSTLAPLLGVQPSAQTSGIQSAPSSSTPISGTDSLSISTAALQALLEPGVDPSQTPSDSTGATHKAHGHHHHRPDDMQAQPGLSDLPGSTSPSAQVPQADQTLSDLLQTKG